MQAGPPRWRRARPVADTPVDELLLRAEDLAKGWLLALVEQAPLEGASQILATDLAREGPRLCDAVVRALAHDSDLQRIQAGGALERLVGEVGPLAGASDSVAVSAAVDALHAVIWSALREELRASDPDLVAELAERLSLVVEAVRAAALRRSVGGRTSLRGARRETDVAVPAAAPEAPVSRGPQAGSLWMGAVEDEIARAEGAGSPLSLLLVELDDADRVVAAESAGEATATFGRFAQAVRTVMRRQDILACESDSRAWIIAPGTARAGAQALGARVAGAVRAIEPWRGAPLTVSIGVAILGEDGKRCDELIASAEEAKFAAAASGIEIVRAETGAEEPPAGPTLVW
jgi:GGDEF domain-containing protein